MLRWTIRGGVGLLVAVALCIGGLVAANWRDEALSPQAARLLAPVAAGSDAYYIFLGLDSPDDENALVAGRRIRAQIELRLRESPVNPEFDDLPRGKAPGCSVGPDCDWSKLSCPPRDADPRGGAGEDVDCVAFYLNGKAQARQYMAQQSLPRQRYQQFSQVAAGFDEPPLRAASEPVLPYASLARAAEMRLMDAVFAFDANDPQTGAQILMREIRVHRQLLANSALLLTKMAAVSLLRRDYGVLSDAIEHWPQLARRVDLADAWRPLQESEYDFGKAIEWEQRWLVVSQYQEYQAWVSPETSGLHRWALLLARRFMFLPNATLNASVHLAGEQIQDFHGDATTLDARRQAAAVRWQEEARQSRQDLSSLSLIRNPLGKMGRRLDLELARPDLFAYAERTYDLDGYIRLVALQAALRRDGVSLAQMADSARQAGPELRNPYDGRPMQWDATHSTLSFTGRQAVPGGRNPSSKVFRVYLR